MMNDIKYTAVLICGNRSSSQKRRVQKKIHDILNNVDVFGPECTRHFKGENKRIWSTFLAVRRGAYNL